MRHEAFRSAGRAPRRNERNRVALFLKKEKTKRKKKKKKKERKEEKLSLPRNASFDINYIIVHEANFHQLYVRAQPSGNM